MMKLMSLLLCTVIVLSISIPASATVVGPSENGWNAAYLAMTAFNTFSIIMNGAMLQADTPNPTMGGFGFVFGVMSVTLATTFYLQDDYDDSQTAILAALAISGAGAIILGAANVYIARKQRAEETSRVRISPSLLQVEGAPAPGFVVKVDF